MNLRKPLYLRHGDVIGIVVPAGSIDPGRIELARDRLHTRGFRTKTYGDITRSCGYLAGDDAARARELITAFEDQETTAVWCARGGYGVVRILERVDFEIICRNPKVFIGFSDITALHLAIQQRAGLITFHGPNLQDGFGAAEDMSPSTEAALWQAVSEVQPPATDCGYVLNASEGNSTASTLSPGTATGPLTGGNLSVLTGLLGTPFEIDTTGHILFLEDVDEPPYRIDRYMAQLHLAGKLRVAEGIVLGSFTDDRAEANADSAILDVLVHYCGDLGIPVLAGFSAGHRRENWTLPMGATVELDADSKLLRVFASAPK